MDHTRSPKIDTGRLKGVTATDEVRLPVLRFGAQRGIAAIAAVRAGRWRCSTANEIRSRRASPASPLNP